MLHLDLRTNQQSLKTRSVVSTVVRWCKEIEHVFVFWIARRPMDLMQDNAHSFAEKSSHWRRWGQTDCTTGFWVPASTSFADVPERATDAADTADAVMRWRGRHTCILNCPPAQVIIILTGMMHREDACMHPCLSAHSPHYEVCPIKCFRLQTTQLLLDQHQPTSEKV